MSFKESFSKTAVSSSSMNKLLQSALQKRVSVQPDAPLKKDVPARAVDAINSALHDIRKAKAKDVLVSATTHYGADDKRSAVAALKNFSKLFPKVKK